MTENTQEDEKAAPAPAEGAAPKFNFNARYAFITYKEHQKPEDILQCLRKKGTDCTAKICHEVGESGYKHTHALVCWDKKIHVRDSRWFDLGDVHPNVERVMGSKHWQRLVKYTEKDREVVHDSLTGNEYQWASAARAWIQSRKSWSEVINTSDEQITRKLQKCMNWCREVWQARPKADLWGERTLRAWQQAEVDKLFKQTDRTVRWIYDQHGGMGKSQLANYLASKHGAFVCESAKMRDIAHAYDDQRIVVFDLARCQEEYTPYRAIESFKNGRIFSGKYNSVAKTFAPCAVIVLANFAPDESKLSADRWDIWSVREEEVDTQGVVPRPLNITSGVLVEEEPKAEAEVSSTESEACTRVEKKRRRRGGRGKKKRRLSELQADARLRRTAQRAAQWADMIGDSEPEDEEPENPVLAALGLV